MENSTASAVLGYRRLAVTLLASTALHAAVIALLALAPAGAHDGGVGAELPPIIEVRLVSVKPVAPEVQGVPRDTTLMAARTHVDPAPAVPRPAPPPPTPARPEPPAQPLGLLAPPRYFPATELDVRPASLAAIDAEYPEHAHGAAGYLVMRVLINEGGAVDRASVAVSDPEGVFDEAAIAAFTAARFAPGRRAGAPVRSELWVEIWFHSPFNRPKVPEPPVARTLSPEDFAPAGARDASSTSP